MVDRSRNLDEAKTQIKSKPRPIQAETQGWSERRLIRPIQAEVDANEEDQQRVIEKRRGWLDPLKQRVNEEWEKSDEMRKRELRWESQMQEREKILIK